MERGKTFIKKYLHGFPKKSQGRYSTKTYLCTVILLTAMILGIFTTPNLLLGQWQNTEAATTDTWNGSAIDTSWAGDGSEGNPYKIATGAQLAGLARKVNGGNSYSGQYFKLTADIDLAGKEWRPIGIGYGAYFYGNFDGGSHTISNLYIHDDNGNAALYVGLFGYTINGKISNLNVSGEINLNIEKTSYVGSIVGNGNSDVENCSSSVNISVTSTRAVYMGGIVGMHSSFKSIINCYNTGSVTAVTKSGSYAGGIVGWAGYILIGCYNTGEVTATGAGKAYAGGLVGTHNQLGKSTAITACYNIGKVAAKVTSSNGKAFAGGLWGLTVANETPGLTVYPINNSYWLKVDGGVEHAYWGAEKGEPSYIDGGSEYGKSEAELKSPEILELLNAASDVYVSDDNNVNGGYPILGKKEITESWMTVADTSWLVDGQGDTEDNPYIIKTAEQLAGIESLNSSTNDYSGKYFKLVADIDLGGRLWKPIGTKSTFCGNFDGDGHTMSN